ncbi:hypothetical protein GCM10010109_01720 [Actinoplanes campanulatus]|nr:hypothetical protein GCM10010109_01720 [Actinoplanes campanulatus]GID34293.1 hypothetical protein Aca09nite_07990 [Actinoplanes campanulatus]
MFPNKSDFSHENRGLGAGRPLPVRNLVITARTSPEKTPQRIRNGPVPVSTTLSSESVRSCFEE